MFLCSAVANTGLADAGIVALLGYGVVFFGLVLLMIVVKVLGSAFTSVEEKEVK